MTASSTTAIEDTLRQRLLTFAPLTGDTVATTLGVTPSGSGSDGKLFWDEAPDNIDTVGGFPYGVLALKNRLADNVVPGRETADLEVMLFGRPRSQKATVEAAADTMDQAMLQYSDGATDGWIKQVGRMRSTLPVFSAPADREVVQVRVVYSLVLYPSYLTQYHATSS